MAASGIAEHNEARRKERNMQRIAFKKKALLNNLREEFGDNPDLMGLGAGQTGSHRDTYEQEVHQSRKIGSPPGHAGTDRHDAAYVDQLRRNQHRQQQLCEYSAKLPKRFSSIDYAAQW